MEQLVSSRIASRPEPAVSRSGYTLRDMLIFAFYSWRAIVFAALIPIAIGGVAAFYAEKEYTSKGLLLVLVNREHSGASGVSGDGPSVLSIEGLKLVQSEAEIIGSDAVLGEVVKAVGPEILYPSLGGARLFGLLPALPPEERARSAVELLRRNLKAEVQDQSNVVQVSFKHRDPILSAAVNTAVIEAYLARRKQVYDVVRSPFINREVARFTADLKDIDSQILTIKARNNVLDIDQDVVLAVNQADIILQRTRQITERRATVLREVEAARGRRDAQPAVVFDYGEQTNVVANDDDRNQLTALLMEREQLTKYYAPNYPGLAQVEQKIARLRATMAAKAQQSFSINRQVRNPALDYIINQLLELEVEAAALDDQIAELNRQYADATGRIDALRDAQAALHELERTRKIMEEIYHDYTIRAQAIRVDEAEAATQQTTNIRVIEMPSVPITGSTLAWSFLAAGIFGGLLLGTAGGVLANWNRQVFLLPGEAEKRLGLPSLASFVQGMPRPGNPASDGELSHLASQIVDTRIGDRGVSLIQILPAGTEDGHTELVRGLVTEFAERRGLRTLLVDLTESQTCARALGVRGRAAPEPVEGVPGLGIASAGEGSNIFVAVGSAAPMFEMRTSLRDAVAGAAVLRDRFDVIAVVSPPLVRSHRGRRIAALVDATVLVLQAEATRSPAAEWAREAVLDAGGDLLGFVLMDRRFHIPSRIYKWL